MRPAIATIKARSVVVAVVWPVEAVKERRGSAWRMVVSSVVSVARREEDGAEERDDDDEKDCPEGNVEERVAECLPL